MDGQKNTTIGEEEEQITLENFSKFLGYLLAKNDDILATLEQLSAIMEANDKEFERRMIDSRTFRDILYKAFGVFTVVQLSTALLFAWVLLDVIK